jgi:hypothetical protein
LPTSLTYIRLLTRGCSPRRPDAVYSTTGRANNSVHRIFKGHRERTGHPRKRGALPSWPPYRLAIRFQGRPLAHVNKKRELSPGLALASPTSLMSPYNIHHPVQESEPDSLSGPTRHGAGKPTPPPPLIHRQRRPSGSTNPCPSAVHTEPFSTSAFKVLI